MDRKAYPTDVSDQEWAFVAPYLTLIIEDAKQREYSLPEVFNGLRWMSSSGSAWRPMLARPADERQRFINKQGVGSKQAYLKPLWMTPRALLRLAEGRSEQPSAVIIDSRT